MKMISMKVPDEVLKRIDGEAEKKGVSRTGLMLERWSGTHKTSEVSQAPVPMSESVPVKSSQVARHASVKSNPKKPEAWFPNSKCPHGWMNSFACEKNHGGCVSSRNG